MLLTFSMGEDCPCPTDIQEELYDFHNQLQLHCGEMQFFFYFFFFIKLLVGFIIVLRLDTIIFNCSDRLQNKAVWIEN